MFRRFPVADLGQLDPKRICLIKPSALGDVVQVLPLLPILRRQFPRAEISWVINKELQDLVEGHPALDESILFERRGGWSAWARLLTTLRQRRFDLVLDFQGLLRTGVMTLATAAKVRVGLQTAREGSRYSLNCILPDTNRDQPAHARYWRLAELMGLGDLPRETSVAIPEADLTWAEDKIRQLPRPIMAVHPGARWVTKRWPVPKFAELLTRAGHSWQGSVLVLGSKAERPDADQLTRQIKENRGGKNSMEVMNLAGESTLKQLAALLARVDVVISNDSGPLHLSAGMGTPTLGIFTCTSAIRSGPPGSQHEMVSTMVDCAASYHKVCPHRGTDHLACMRELDVERVWMALQRLVTRAGQTQTL